MILGLVTVFWFYRSGGNSSESNASDKEEEEDEPDPVHEDVPPEYIPEGGIFTDETLAPLDGQKLPLCMGVCGKVVNCSASGSIRHGVGYGALWAGRDATYALATLSLNKDDAGRRDFTLEDFNAEQQKALAGWYKHFTTKYQVIGTMKEYEGWDFSAIEELAKDQNPFSTSKDSETASDEAPQRSNEGDSGETPSQSNEASTASPSAAKAEATPVTLRKGDRVQLQKLVSSSDLNGQFGILEDFNKEKGRFVIRIESTGKTMLFKPENLSVVNSMEM
jgi:hypothetical protein